MLGKFNINRFRIFVFFTLSLIYTTLWYVLSVKLGFGGDERYTYNITQLHKPIPYVVIIDFLLSYIKLDEQNLLYIRSSSLFFMIAAFVIWIFFILKERRSIILFSLLIITNSFLLSESVYLRYYSYYFLSSSLILLIFLKLRYHTLKTKLISLSFITLISPYFLYPINAIQTISLALYNLSTSGFKKSILFCLFVILITSFLLIIKPEFFWSFFQFLNFNSQTDFDINGELRGFRFVTLIKPIYSFYQIIFGYYLTITSVIYAPILFILISMMSVYVIYLIYLKDRYLFDVSIFGGVIPLFVTFYVLETLSFSGSMLLYAKHVTFFATFFFFCISISHKFLTIKQFLILSGLILSAQTIGLVNTLNANYEDWQKVNEILKEELKNDTTLILEDIANASLLPFDFKETKRINLSSLKGDINLEDQKYILLLRDRAYYTALEVNQNWDFGRENFEEVGAIQKILTSLSGYNLLKSYVAWPLFLYVYEKSDDNKMISSSSLWGIHLKDLELPARVNNGKGTIISSVSIKPGETSKIYNQPIMIMNVENIGKSSNKDIKIGKFICGLDEINLELNKNIWDVFAEFKAVNVSEENIAFSWFHNPLMSSSNRYNGSLSRHKSNLYYFDNKTCHDSTVSIINESTDYTIRNWIIDFD